MTNINLSKKIIYKNSPILGKLKEKFNCDSKQENLYAAFFISTLSIFLILAISLLTSLLDNISAPKAIKGIFFISCTSFSFFMFYCVLSHISDREKTIIEKLDKIDLLTIFENLSYEEKEKSKAILRLALEDKLNTSNLKFSDFIKLEEKFEKLQQEKFLLENEELIKKQKEIKTNRILNYINN